MNTPLTPQLPLSATGLSATDVYALLENRGWAGREIDSALEIATSTEMYRDAGVRIFYDPENNVYTMLARR